MKPLEQPAITFEWDTEGKYSLSAVEDSIYTEEPDQEALKAKGEIALHSSFFNEGTEGWVIYKLEDLKRILGEDIKLDPFTKKEKNFLAAFKNTVKLFGPGFDGMFDPEDTDINSLMNPGTTVSFSPTTKKLLEAYNSPQEGWVMVPPKDKLKADQAFVVGVGAIGFEGNGRWKIHVSIDPAQMEEAIPIIAAVLHSENAPRLGFKMQTKANLDSVHQIGKELAIIFDEQVEAAALKGDLTGIQDCLNLLWNKLNAAGIRPEPGLVLTPQTMNNIKNSPEGSQVKEKVNLNIGKFDRAIPCPEGRNFFFYRDENITPMLDNEIGDLKGLPEIYAASDIIKLAHKEPDFAHNPSKTPDPFINLTIKAS